MSLEISALLALGALNLVLGLLIVFVCFRLSALNKQVSDVEKRVSRLEILTSLADSKSKDSKGPKDSKDAQVSQAIMRRAGGTS
jgi:hypothetical protein